MLIKKLKTLFCFTLFSIVFFSCGDKKNTPKEIDKPTTVIEKSTDFERDSIRKDALKVEKELRKIEKQK